MVKRPSKPARRKAKKPARKAAPKKTAKKTARKAAPKKTARKTVRKAAPKKTARKTVRKAAPKKTARKTARKAAPKKTARKTVRKAAPKKTARKTTRKAAPKKATRKTTRKAAPKRTVRKAARKAAPKKTARKTTRKAAPKKAARKSAAKKAAKKTAKKATRKTAKKTTRKAAPKKAGRKKATKKTGRKKASKKASRKAAVKKPAAKTAKRKPAARAARRTVKRATRKAAPKKAARPAARRTGQRSAARGRTRRPTFMGWRRKNGRVGVRNHVVILPLDDLSNAAAEAVANNIKGTLAIPHAYGRLQFGEDLELFFRTLIGTGSNPNVAAAIVIGIEPGWTGRIVRGIAKTGKPVSGFAIEQHGDIETIAAASRQAKEYLQWASEQEREECGIEDLWVSVKCGESDTTSGLASNPTVGNFIDKVNRWGATTCFGETSEITGAERVCAKRGNTREIGQKFLDTWQAYMDEVIEPFKTDDLSDSQPTKGNIEGGLTTIEEKAFGNLEKIGKRTRYIDVLEPAQEPKKGSGLYFMDTSSAAAECVTLQAAAGFVVHLFPTGQGNIIGNPIEPVIKLSANPRTVRTMGEHVDLDVSGILRRKMNLDQAGDALIDITIRTCNGRLTAAEALGHREFSLTKLYRSA